MSERTYGGYTVEQLRALRSGAPEDDIIEIWNAADDTFAAHTQGAVPFYDAAYAAIPALLDDLARIRAAARAFCEERTEAALIALWNEVER